MTPLVRLDGVGFAYPNAAPGRSRFEIRDLSFAVAPGEVLDLEVTLGRLSARAGTGHDLRGLLRGGADDEAIAAAIRGRWHSRDDRYSEIRAEATPSEKVEMSHIGG